MKNAPALQAVPLLILLSGIVQNTTCCKDLACFVDYIDTLTCTYKISHHGLNGMFYNLTATWITESPEKGLPACSLIQLTGNKSHAEFMCTNLSMRYLESEDSFTVHIMEGDAKGYRRSKECRDFAAIEHFKPRPPFNLSISFSADYNVSWQTVYEGYYLLRNELEYELRYKKTSDPWEDHQSVPITRDEKRLLLLQSSLHWNTEYEAQVRAKPGGHSEYKGVWSDWSRSLTWRTNEGKEESLDRLRPWLGGVLFVLAIGLMIFLYKSFSLLKRVWRQVWVLTPNPEPFFKPLYMGHNGDFKSWLGASYTMATIDFFDWGIGLPEVLQVYKHIPQESAKVDFRGGGKRHKLPTCKSCKEHSKSGSSCALSGGATEDTSCGHVSIDTVTVADEVTPCCPQCFCNRLERNDMHVDDGHNSKDSNYPAVNFDDSKSHGESKRLAAASSAGDDIFSGSASTASCGRCELEPIGEPMQGSLASSLEPNMNILDLLCMERDEWDLQSSASYRAAEDESISYDSDAENFGYPRICLDLDTIDSGFVDSECGSPTECEFEKNDITQTDSTESVQLQGDIQCPRSYVKQWISINSTITNNESQKS
ncbi:interleukin-21 receptor [Rhinatrema bivittatum]|uniref:interleukin-21 receptor n=1 Tax=Rhinatrema bivittatum TaxID=194408 RepID=UPI00112625E2|nr:interleukin-21 receptor [Rhinatrema bivittatum]